MKHRVGLLSLVLVFGCDTSGTPPESETAPDAAAPDADALGPAGDAGTGDAAPEMLPDASSDASSVPGIPGLGAGSHLGVFDGYELPGAAAAAAVAVRREELVTAGSDIARVHVSFRALAPEPGLSLIHI